MSRGVGHGAMGVGLALSAYLVDGPLVEPVFALLGLPVEQRRKNTQASPLKRRANSVLIKGPPCYAVEVVGETYIR